jgi:hypothetical protein
MSRSRRGVAAAGAGLVVVIAVLAGRSSVGAPKPVAAATPAANMQKTLPGTLVEFRDEQRGWAIAYPKTWNRLQSKDADVVLVVSEKPPEVNNGGSILGRTVTLGAPVDESRLAAARAVTDQIVNGEGVQLLAEPTIVHQGGLPGWFYFYSFRDPATGQEGVHSHYFLFRGSTMISFVFQALPKDAFGGLANLYDDVIGSFRLVKETGDGAG